VLLAQAVAATNVRVSPWQIERWRQAGLLPAASRQYPGRGSGSIASYPPEAVARVVEVAGLVRPRHPLSEVALILFARGRTIPSEVVKRAYCEWLDGLEKWLGSAGTPEARFELAETKAARMVPWVVGTKTGRRMRRRAKGRPETAESVLLSAFTNLLLVLLGEDVPDDALLEVLDVGGVTAMFRDTIGGFGPIAEGPSQDLFRLIRRSNLRTLRASVTAASTDELFRLSQVAASITRFAKPFTVAARALGKRDAFGLAPMVEFGEDIDFAHGAAFLLLIKDLVASSDGTKVLTLMESRTPYFAALAALLRSLPKPVVERVAQGKPDALASLSAPERDRVRAEAAHIEALGAAAITGAEEAASLGVST